MHKIKEMLMAELYDYEEKAKKMNGGKMTTVDLEKIHKLTDTIKNIDKIEALEDGEGYSEGTDFMGEGRMYGTSYEGGSSYRRGRGRTARRDSMGRYSREPRYSDGYDRMYSRDGAKAHLIDRAEELLGMASDERERRAIHQFIQTLENE